MASPVSDLLQPLCVYIPETISSLAPGAIFITPKIIAGQYSSIIVTGVSETPNTDFAVTFEYSPDGFHWDSKHFHTFTSGITYNEPISEVIYSKYLRLEVKNIGTATINSNFRLTTYGSISNTTITTDLSVESGVDVLNWPLTAFGALNAAETHPIYSFTFERGGTSGSETIGEFYSLGHDELYTYSHESTDLLPLTINTRAQVQQGALNLYFDEQTPNFGAQITYGNGIIYSPYAFYSPGIGLEMMFTAGFYQNVEVGGIYKRMLVGLGDFNSSGVPDVNSGTINFYDFLGFGYFGPNLPTTSFDESAFGILYQRANITEGGDCDPHLFIPQNAWNGDKGLGFGSLPVMNWTNINVFKIDLQYLGAGNVRFFVENPRDGEFVLIHELNYAGSSLKSITKYPAFRMIACVQSKLVVSDPPDASDFSTLDADNAGDPSKLRIPCMSIRHQGNAIAKSSLYACALNAPSPIGIPSAETFMFGIENISPIGSFGNSDGSTTNCLNRFGVEIDTISFAVSRNTGGNFLTTFFLYRGGSRKSNEPPGWQPAEEYKFGNVGSGVIRTPVNITQDTDDIEKGNSKLVRVFNMSGNNSVDFTLASDSHADKNNHYVLQPGEVWYLQAKINGGTAIAPTEVVFSFTFNVI